jgi:uncharacterized protein YifE (UPF0438 family)
VKSIIPHNEKLETSAQDYTHMKAGDLVRYKGELGIILIMGPRVLAGILLNEGERYVNRHHISLVADIQLKTKGLHEKAEQEAAARKAVLLDPYKALRKAIAIELRNHTEGCLGPTEVRAMRLADTMENKSVQDAHEELIDICLSDISHIGYKLTKRERAILGKYGAWMEALIDGRIAPFTLGQRRFIQVSKRQAEARTELEQTWVAVINARNEIKNKLCTLQPEIYIPHQPSVQVCPQCGMVGDNCTCRRSWY